MSGDSPSMPPETQKPSIQDLKFVDVPAAQKLPAFKATEPAKQVKSFDELKESLIHPIGFMQVRETVKELTNFSLSEMVSAFGSGVKARVVSGKGLEIPAATSIMINAINEKIEKERDLTADESDNLKSFFDSVGEMVLDLRKKNPATKVMGGGEHYKEQKTESPCERDIVFALDGFVKTHEEKVANLIAGPAYVLRDSMEPGVSKSANNLIEYFEIKQTQTSAS